MKQRPYGLPKQPKPLDLFTLVLVDVFNSMAVRQVITVFLQSQYESVKKEKSSESTTSKRIPQQTSSQKHVTDFMRLN